MDGVHLRHMMQAFAAEKQRGGRAYHEVLSLFSVTRGGSDGGVGAAVGGQNQEPRHEVPERRNEGNGASTTLLWPQPSDQLNGSYSGEAIEILETMKRDFDIAGFNFPTFSRNIF